MITEQVPSNQSGEVRRLRLVSGYWHSPISDYKEPIYSEYVEAKHYDALRAEVERLKAAIRMEAAFCKENGGCCFDSLLELCGPADVAAEDKA